LQIVIFAIVIALALISLPPETARPLLDLLGATEAVAIAVVRWVMLLAPWAVFGLLARTIIATGTDVLLGLGYYAAVTLGGFLVLLGVYALNLLLLAKRNPLRFFGAIREPVLLAFSTNSSAATMPLTLQTAEEKLNIKPSVARFVIPLGTTVNMDSTALNQALATVFLAQLSGMELSTSALAVVLVTIVGASIGTPGTPGVGILILAGVLGPLGIPIENLSLIIGMDRLLGMFRSGLNVMGDLVATAVMDRLPSEQTAWQEREAEAQLLHQKD
jgi:Na+/H+-dicarboxylate symporter